MHKCTPLYTFCEGGNVLLGEKKKNKAGDHNFADGSISVHIVLL